MVHDLNSQRQMERVKEPKYIVSGSHVPSKVKFTRHRIPTFEFSEYMRAVMSVAHLRRASAAASHFDTE